MSELEDSINSILNDPGQMSRIAEIAKSLMGGGEEETKAEAGSAPPLPFMGADPASIGRIGRIMSELNNESDDKTALFKAMEPYLSEKRREKMDKAIKIARLARIARLAMGEMGDGDV